MDRGILDNESDRKSIEVHVKEGLMNALLQMSGRNSAFSHNIMAQTDTTPTSEQILIFLDQRGV